MGILMTGRKFSQLRSLEEFLRSFRNSRVCAHLLIDVALAPKFARLGLESRRLPREDAYAPRSSSSFLAPFFFGCFARHVA